MIRETPGEAMTTLRWTSQDLELLPDNGKRYEIVDGELYVSKQPNWYHQYEADMLQSPHLPGFSCQVSEIFDDVF